MGRNEFQGMSLLPRGRMAAALGLVAVVAALACARPSRPAKSPGGAVRPPLPELRVASWNIRRLGQADTRLDVVAEIVAAEFDVLALQEVMERKAVDELLELLPGWAAVASDTAVGRGGYQEHYAVLYRTDIARVVRSFSTVDPSDALAREPLVACLRAASFDFCIVDVHITYAGGAKARDDEIEALGAMVEDLRDGSSEKDWIVVGDFNRKDTARGFEWLHDAGWRCVLQSAPPTTIGRKSYTNAYDHLLVDRRFTSELRRADRFPLIETQCPEKPSWCAENLSDHAPVVATFSIDGPDDD